MIGNTSEILYGLVKFSFDSSKVTSARDNFVCLTGEI